MKYVLAFFVIIVVSLASVYADEGYIPYFPDFLEPDGIKFRYSQEYYETYISYRNAGAYTEIISTQNKLRHLGPTSSFPISITLPETLMNSWSFRGAILEYQNETLVKDLPPNGLNANLHATMTYWTHSSDKRTYIYNNFFNNSEKSFADTNSNWGLSADILSSRILLGYYWGVFISNR